MPRFSSILGVQWTGVSFIVLLESEQKSSLETPTSNLNIDLEKFDNSDVYKNKLKNEKDLKYVKIVRLFVLFDSSLVNSKIRIQLFAGCYIYFPIARSPDGDYVFHVSAPGWNVPS